MGGIAGVVRRDGAPGTALLVEAMLARMAPRGGVGRVVERGGSALGTLVPARTATAAAAAEPIVGGGGRHDGVQVGPAGILVAEARFDRIGPAFRSSGGGALSPVLERLAGAVAAHGAGAMTGWDGDFAFALALDDGRVVLGRDHFGVRQLYYHCSAERLVFATELKALFACPGVPRRVNRARVVDYLVDAWVDWEATLYEGVYAVPPAHLVEVSPGAAPAARRYWALDPHREVPAAPLAAHAEQFREVFLEAIRVRLPAERDVASMLSGGLDSSSVTAAAATLLEDRHDVRSLSAIFPGFPGADESEFINDVAVLPGVVPRNFEPMRVGALRYFEGEDWGEDEPYWPGTSIHALAFPLAAEASCDVLLDGIGGDDVVSHGFGAVPELLLRGRVGRAAGALRAVHREFDWPYAGLARRWVVGPFVPNRLRGWRDARAGRLPGTLSMPLRDDVRAGLQLDQRLDSSADAPTRTERARHFAELVSPLDPVAFGAQERLAARSGVTPRYPFYDRRLVELCLALPAEAKVSGGYTRAVLREAMRGILPEAIRTRRGKGSVAPALAGAARRFDGPILDDMIAAPGALAELVDTRRLADIVARFRAGSDADFSTVQRAAVMWRWLRKNG